MKGRLLLCFFLSFVSLSSVQAKETSIQAIALFEGKAMLSINGAKPKIIKKGQLFKGVKLLSSTTQLAMIEVDGKTQSLELNGTTVLQSGFTPSSKASVQLFENSNGFFTGDGKINGRNVNFLVDTGANMVALSSEHAKRIGLEYESGEKTFASTASGMAPMYLIEIERISLKGLQLTNIEAGVIEGSFPMIPLLGMSYLSQLNMERKGNMMTLQKR